MTLLVATRNRGKQAEFRQLLTSLGEAIVFPEAAGIPESREEDLLESADTFLDNARAKAWWFAGRTGLATLADDSGLEVDALRGAPGVHSKRYAGLSGTDDLVTDGNNAALLSALQGIPVGQRTARYRCVLVIVRPVNLREWRWSLPEPGGELVAEGTTTGRILEAPSGSAGFGYDPIFFSTELQSSFGDVTADAKHTVSHRGRAAAALLRQLCNGIRPGG